MSESTLLFGEAENVYEAWLSEQGYTARQGQLDMIQFIADAMTRKHSRIGVVEAGTGTGKTIAYCIPAILEARKRNKKVVIVTSTVLLQSQLVATELRQLAQLFSPALTFGIIKGRRRYVCTDRLDKVAHGEDGESRDLFGNETPSATERNLANELLAQFNERRWNGDMDSAPIPLTNKQRDALTTDALGCHRSTCNHARGCPYFKARDHVSTLDVVVTNYSLLLTAEIQNVDLLPSPENSIYIFDEVHQLGRIVKDAGSSRTSTHVITDTVKKVEKFGDQLISSVGKGHPFAGSYQDLLNMLPRIGPIVEDLRNHFSELSQSPNVEVNSNGDTFRFPAGKIDKATNTRTGRANVAIGALHDVLSELYRTMDSARDEKPQWIAHDVLLQALRSLSELVGSVQDMRNLLSDWAASGLRAAARWLSKQRGEEWQMHTVPIGIHEILQNAVWSKVHSVICTSATIVSNQGFEQFKQELGLDLPDDHFQRIPSPFDFRNHVRFQVADFKVDPSNGAAFKQATLDYLPSLLARDQSALVLFTSRADMNEVFGKLPQSFRQFCLNQDSRSMAETLRVHREAIDQGKRSYILGLASYREGVDLPGDYCQHVVIVRLPFNVPGDPVIKSQYELLGLENPFMQFDLPQASLRLFQACGRLLRNETDRGTITILDRRIIDKRYGKELIRPLPDYDIVDLKHA